MARRATTNQEVYLGPETIPGTSVPATKRLTAFTWTFGAKPTTKQFVPTGGKYPAASEMLTDMSAGKLSGQGDFNQIVYPISGVFGKVTPVAHAPSTTAYDWAFQPPVVGKANPQTYTAQQGEPGAEAEEYDYLLFTGFGYSFTRKQEVQFTADWIARAQQTGATLAASPVTVAMLTMTGAQANMYLDATSAQLGTTLLAAPFNVAFAGSGFYDATWPINRANASFEDHVDKVPKNELKIKLEANITGIAVKGSYLATGTRCYVRTDIQGQLIDAPNSVNAKVQHDMACFVTDVSELADVDGVYAVEYTLAVAEDMTWGASGTAQKLTVTCLLQTL